MSSSTQQTRGFILRLVGREKVEGRPGSFYRRKATQFAGDVAAPGEGRRNEGVRALRLREGKRVRGGEANLNSGTLRAVGLRKTLRARTGHPRLLCLLYPKEKNKVGGRQREQPSMFPPLVSALRPGLRRAGRGRGTRRSNSSQQVQASAGLRGPAAGPPPSVPTPPLPRRPDPAGEAGSALFALPVSPRPPGLVL